jgi:hypothetical protein
VGINRYCGCFIRPCPRKKWKGRKGYVIEGKKGGERRDAKRQVILEESRKCTVSL